MPFCQMRFPIHIGSLQDFWTVGFTFKRNRGANARNPHQYHSPQPRLNAYQLVRLALMKFLRTAFYTSKIIPLDNEKSHLMLD